MSIGDFLANAEDWAVRLADSLSDPVSQKLIAASQGAPPPAKELPPGQTLIQAGVEGVFKPFGIAMEPVLKAPVVGGVANTVFQALAVTPRAINTALISAQHAEASGPNNTTDWGEFFNRSTWSKAWDMAAFGSANPVTSGQIIFGSSFRSGNELDPFNPTEAALIQKNANSTWYGATLTTLTDLGLSFIGPPGTGQLAKVRGATGMRTAEDATSVFARHAEVTNNGATTFADARSAGQKAKDKALHLMVPNGAANVDARVAEQVAGLRVFDKNMDEGHIFNQVKARVPLAPDGAVAAITNQLVEINKFTADPALRERLRLSLFTAAHGSLSAKEAFIADAPHLAKNFENLTSVPREFGAFTDFYHMRLTPGEDLPINDFIDRHWGTSSDRAELEALKGVVQQKKTAYKEHARLVAEIRDLRPRVLDTHEARHIKAKRDELHSEVKRLDAELQQAKKDLHGTRRWAAGQAKATTKAAAGTDLTAGVGRSDFAAGPLSQHADLNQALGDARRRVEDLTSQLKQARSDRALLDSTPLHDPTLLEDWQGMVGEARLLRSGARDALDAAKADREALKQQLAVKEAEIATVRAHLNKDANARITEILDIAGPESTMALPGSMAPTVLDRLKAHIRDRIGDEQTVTAGNGNTIITLRTLPTRAARWATAPVARGSIALNEIGVGVRQLQDTMNRAGVFSPEEVVAYRNALIRAQAADRVGIIARVQDEMVQRIAVNWFKDRMPGLTPEEAVKQAKEMSNLTLKAWGQGNKWVVKAAADQADSALVFVRDIDGRVVGYDGPSLRSQLADSAPIIDPWDLQRSLVEHSGLLKANVQMGMHALHNAHDFLISVWKTSALVRPGLMTRSMIDTGPRALASMTMLESLISSFNGALNVTHNRGLNTLARLHLSSLTLEERAALMREIQKDTSTKLGGQDFRAARDMNDVVINNMAATKGTSTVEALQGELADAYSKYIVDRSSWVYRDPNSANWHLGYKEYADMLLASPTARLVADLRLKADSAVSMDALFEKIKSSPEFAREYPVMAQPAGLTRSQWAQRLVNETSAMFPNEALLNAAKNRGLSKKFIEKQFPRTERFEIPSPEISSMEAGAFLKFSTKVLNKAYKVLLDMPDVWIARSPVFTQLFHRQVKREYAALEATHGPGYMLSPREAQMIDSRARTAALGYVRHTFFDTTRYTPMHRMLGKISPFIAAWEDAMISWGRLIYDDPRRLAKLSAAYHAPYTVATSLNSNLVLDESGQPLPRGKEANGVFVAIPLGALGRKVGVPYYRMRLDAINSIAQGETWWLPGVAPTVSVPLAWALGSDKVISREAALDLVETDSPMGKAILKSVFLGGEIPASDPGSLFKSTQPGWARIMATDLLGTGKLNTQLTQFNYLISEERKNGRNPGLEEQNKLWEQAGKSAIAAGAIRLAMSAGFGFTGTAAVDGQFYSDQMNLIYAMTPEQRGGLTPLEFFAQKYPEAADLNYSFTKNESGIVASVNAVKAEARLRPLLKKYPEKLGWMILGADNVVNPEFSRTAYAMQKSDGARVYDDPEQVKLDAMAAVGWNQYTKWSQQIEDSLVARGVDPKKVRTNKEYLAARKKIREYISQNNPSFSQVSQASANSFGDYYNQALAFSQSGPLKDRSDFKRFAEYDAARTAVMQKYGIKSFSGTGQKYAEARAVMIQVGALQSSRDFGFQQMWDRFLEREFN